MRVLEQDKKELLYIPANIKTRVEFFEGFGMSELIMTLIMLIISVIVAITIYNINYNMIVCVFIVLISTAITIALVTKDHNNQSMLDFVIHLIQFCGEQKKYRYVYKEDFINDFKDLLPKDI